MVLLQYVFNIFHYKINPDKMTLKHFLIEDYKYINDTDDFDKEIRILFKEKIISLMNKMINRKKTNTNQNKHICKFFNTTKGCRNNDKCNFTHIIEQSNNLGLKDL